MKNTSFLITAALLCAAPLTAQETEVTTEAPVVEQSTAPSELIEKATMALMGSQWTSTFEVVAEQPEGESTITLNMSMQDLTHFSAAITMTAEDPFEGEVTQNHTIMCDGEFLYADIDGIAEMSQGMFNGPVKIELPALLGMMDMEEAPTAEDMMPMIAGMIGTMPLAEEGSTEKIRRYTATSDEEGSMTVCFDAVTFFLSSVEAVNADGSKMSITAKDTAIVEEFEEGHFTFNGEAQDVTAMLAMMGGGGGAAPADEDLEF
ncbi:MAG: hypothetical protein ACKVJZ_06400 [Planctomycetota bacterium]